MKLCKSTAEMYVLIVSKFLTTNTPVQAITHTHMHASVLCLSRERLQPLTAYSHLCIITSLTACTVQRQMLRMTHLGNKLFVLLVQISSGSHVVSPYSQPALLGKPGNKARIQITQWDYGSDRNHHHHRNKQHKTLPYLTDKAPRRNG